MSTDLDAKGLMTADLTSDQRHCLVNMTDESHAKRLYAPHTDGWVSLLGAWLCIAEELVGLGLLERRDAKPPSMRLDNTKAAKYRPTDDGIGLAAQIVAELDAKVGS